MRLLIAVFAALFLCLSVSYAQQAPQIDPEVLKQLEASGYETDPEVFKAIATGGKPLGRWKEGLLFDGIEPMPWLASAANWFPGKEDV